MGRSPSRIAAALAVLLLTPAVATAQSSPADKQVARGKYLVNLGGCNDCHTPGYFLGKPDQARYLGGSDVGFEMPGLGTFMPPNLTPDKDTGLGSWTEDMFVRAVRTGRHMGGNGRPILPPMPWPNVGQLSDGDIKAVFAFLQNIPAIRNDVPAPKVPDAVMDGIAASYDKMMKKMHAQAAAQAAQGANTAVAQR